MRRSTRLLLSALCGVCAAGMAFLAVSSAEQEAAAARAEALAAHGGEVVEACVVTQPLEAGDAVDASCVEVRDWVAELLPEDACTSLSEVEGRSVTERVPVGAVLAETYFVRGRGRVEVPDACVAVSVPLQQEYALGGALAEGEEVDVYVTRDGVADRIAAGARVIDASTFGTDGSGSLEWATLAVEPTLVGELLAASARGTVSLTLAGADAAGGSPAPGEEGAAAPAPNGEEAGADGPAADEGAESNAGAAAQGAEAPVQAEGTEAR